MTEETTPANGVKVDVQISRKALTYAAATAVIVGVAKYVLKTKAPAVAEVVSEATTPES